MINNNNAVVTAIRVKPHPNADRLQLGEVMEFTVAVGLDVKDGDLGIFFNEGLALSPEFLEKNDLVRRKLPDGSPAGGMFEPNGRVRCQTFRGEKSEGFWCPISFLNYTGKRLSEGDSFTKLGDHEVCKKYVRPHQHVPGKPGKKVARGETVMFKKHFDTAQMRMNYGQVRKGDVVVVSAKLHGSSARVGHVKEELKLKWWERLIRRPNTKWTYLIGSRNVIVSDSMGEIKDGFYSSDLRLKAAQPFLFRLRKGETVFYEIVGFDGDSPIMPGCSTEKLSKAERKIYGDKVEWTYGCKPGEFDIYVYRITLTDEDGHSHDMAWPDVVSRCGALGIKPVPVLSTFIFDGDTERLRRYVEEVTEGPDLINSAQPREGVCVRVDHNPLKVFKNKSFTFKVLEGIISDCVIDPEDIS